MKCFAGNMLQVKSIDGGKFIVLSKTAFRELSDQQIEQLKTHGTLLPVDVSTIEHVNGGSVRCMMAEIFLSGRD